MAVKIKVEEKNGVNLNEQNGCQVNMIPTHDITHQF